MRTSGVAAVVSVLLLASAESSGQTYLTAQTPATYVALSGATPISFFDTDDGSSFVPLGFTYDFYGVSYTYVNVGVNGVISFAKPCAGQLDCGGGGLSTCNANNVCEPVFGFITYLNTPLPSTGEPNQKIAPWWDDLFLSTASPAASVSYMTIGAPGNREFVVQWANIRTLGGAVSSTNFQVWLSEANGGVRIKYGPYVADAFENNAGDGALGIEDENGIQASVPLACAVGSLCDYTTLIALQDQQIEFFAPTGPDPVQDVDEYPREKAHQEFGQQGIDVNCD